MTNDEKRTYAIAQHEATHAITAMHLGVPVAWVSIEDGLEEDIHFTAAVRIPDDMLDPERDRFAVLVSMAAPSFLKTYDKEIDRYAQTEAVAAYRLADKYDLDSDHVYDEAATITGDHFAEVYDLAERLVAEGKVVFERADSEGHEHETVPLDTLFEQVPVVLAVPYREPTREERAARNTCNLCTPWLIEGSDERLLAVEDFGGLLRKTLLYRNTEETKAVVAERERPDRDSRRR